MSEGSFSSKCWLFWLSFQFVVSSLTVFHEIILELYFLAPKLFTFVILYYYYIIFFRGDLLDFFFAKFLYLFFSILNFNLFVFSSFKKLLFSNSRKTLVFIVLCSFLFSLHFSEIFYYFFPKF